MKTFIQDSFQVDLKPKKIPLLFQRSSLSATDLPKQNPYMQEILLAGRSNAGKSTALNLIAGRNIARTGKRPGTTRAINIYLCEETDRFLLDLPGYGFSFISKKEVNRLDRLFQFSLKTRTNLCATILFLDIRRGLVQKDIDFLNLLPKNQYLHCVATKTDQVGTNKKRLSLISIKDSIRSIWGELSSFQYFSRDKQESIEELRNRIREIFEITKKRTELS